MGPDDNILNILNAFDEAKTPNNKFHSAFFDHFGSHIDVAPLYSSDQFHHVDFIREHLIRVYIDLVLLHIASYARDLTHSLYGGQLKFNEPVLGGS
ncbi:hypothetical protein ES703_27629 [subsurface metagenome]